LVGRDEILFPIVIEIANRYGVRAIASAEVGGSAEIAHAIAQQDRHVAGIIIWIGA